MKTHYRKLILTGLFVPIALVCFTLSILIGSVSIQPIDAFSAIITELTGLGGIPNDQGKQDSLIQAIIWELRFPRSIAAFVTGGLLSLSGAIMQVLLRNPLADPGILGVSGGAAVMALLTISFGFSGYWVSQNAFLGALFSMFLVFGLAHRNGSWNPLRLLLTGVVIAAGWGAITSFILATSPSDRVVSMIFWQMGDLSDSPTPVFGLWVLLIGLVVCLYFSRPMNLLTRGDIQAKSLGVPVKYLRITLYFLASLLTATAVTIAGTVGFVGLIVPHILRLLGLSDHRYLLVGAVLFGGALLMAADLLARTIISPQQLPVGVVTAFIGVPIFLYILNRDASKT